MASPSTMRAWLCRRYGPPEVLVLDEVALALLAPHELRIRVRATTVSSGDSRMRGLRLPPGFGPLGRLIFGFRGPRQPILGSEIAGVVEAVGGAVTRFRPGDAVIAFTDFKLGGHAEFVTIAEDRLVVLKPSNLTFEEASCLSFGGTTARDYLRKAGLIAGERLLVIGASGTVGSACVQLAKSVGAHVSAVTSTGNIELVRALGADAIIDYKTTDFMALGQRWDVIADVVAASRFVRCLPVLNEGGRYLAIAGGLADMLAGRRGTKRSIAGPAATTLDDLHALVHLAETGAFKPPIDSVYPFAAMRDAHARTDAGRKRGAVVVRLADG